MSAEGCFHIAMSGSPYVLDTVRRSYRVCSNCFRLRKESDPLPALIREKAKSTLWASAITEPTARTPTTVVDAPPGDTVSERSPRTVCDCGAVSAYTTAHHRTDPLDKSTAIEYADNISDTLDTLAHDALERGNLGRSARLDHDRDTLFDVTRHLKSQPEYQFRDDDIFTAAVEVACRATSNE